jgi:tRNA pseudouridine38-40 synthase
VVDTTVNARFSAQWRQYRYHVLTTSDANPFLAATTWHVPGPLDLAAMTMACDPLIGEHDFTSLCRKPVVKPGRLVPTMRRRVLSAAWSTVEGGPHEVDGLLRFEIRATAFCHQMVRSIVGLHVDIGRGRRHAGEVMGVLRARDRAAGSPVAPPQGLCLWEVGY